jgi:hypothetical protein
MTITPNLFASQCMNSPEIPSSLPFPRGSTSVDPECKHLGRLNENIGNTDQGVWVIRGMANQLAMSRFDKFVIALVAASVCGYVARTHINCALDPHCHMNWCHRRVAEFPTMRKQNE